jgi:hypothetical protein
MATCNAWEMNRCPSDSYMQKKKKKKKKKSWRRNVGSPRSRCLDEVNTDARRMGVRMWWRKDLDRGEWRNLLMEAKTLQEL